MPEHQDTPTKNAAFRAGWNHIIFQSTFAFRDHYRFRRFGNRVSVNHLRLVRATGDKNYVPGWASLMLAVLFIGGVQLISIGIIGEYISRMSSNIRNRPLYILRETNLPEPDQEKD